MSADQSSSLRTSQSEDYNGPIPGVTEAMVVRLLAQDRPLMERVREFAEIVRAGEFERGRQAGIQEAMKRLAP